MIKPIFLFRIFDEILEAMGSSVNEFQAAKLQKEIRVAVSLLFSIYYLYQHERELQFIDDNVCTYVRQKFTLHKFLVKNSHI